MTKNKQKQFSSSADFEYELSDLDAMSMATNYNNWILDKIGKYVGDNTIECGAGSGSFAKSILARYKTNFIALEPSKSAFEKLKKDFSGLNNVTCLPNFLSQIANQITNKIDGVIYNNVLEHVENDQQEIDLAYKSLKVGGYIITFSPALPILYSNYDNTIGHFRRYTLKEMVIKIKKAGFNVVDSYYFDFLGTFLWFIKYKILKDSNLSSSSVSIYDKLLIPVLRKLEPSKLLPFGKNIVVIGKK
ncbi:MAG: class I SAM-dependent methyltransferase [bacterium]